jgi:sugar phosphate permease
MPTAATPLLPSGAVAWHRCVASRQHWAWITVVVLFIGKGATPFAVDILHAVQTALISDDAMGFDTQSLSQLSSSSLLCGALSKLLAAPLLHRLGPRTLWMIVLASGASMLAVIAATRSTAVLFVAWDLSAVAAAWAMPATSMIIAAWVDGHMLGQALGIISVSTKVRRACHSARSLHV